LRIFVSPQSKWYCDYGEVVGKADLSQQVLKRRFILTLPKEFTPMGQPTQERLGWKHLIIALGMLMAGPAMAEEGTYTVRHLTPENALKAAQATLDKCRKNGFQISVAVVDRSGVPQVMLRDRLAGMHTTDTATRKAWTAVSFRVSTAEMVESTEPGKPMAAIRNLPNVAILGGGLPILSKGAIVGGIGVSGAPGGVRDEECAQAGLAAIAFELE
jgi:uncharacterized protein GlcG (DUF336 family)